MRLTVEEEILEELREIKAALLKKGTYWFEKSGFLPEILNELREIKAALYRVAGALEQLPRE